MVRGWVYVISNRAMPKLVKVGFSERDPVNRASELGAGTEVPFRYEVIYDVLVYSPFEVEQQVHRRLADVRAGKEWFECNWIEAIEAVRRTATELNRILAEKEYDILTEFRAKQALEEQELREKEAKEKLLRARAAYAKEARGLNERSRTPDVEHVGDTTRIAVCPKCHTNVKTRGKPPPYFCFACGHQFIAGL